MRNGTSLETVLLVCRAYPPFTGASESPGARWVASVQPSGRRIEIIAPSDGEEEFTHLDAGRNLVHRIHPGRSYALAWLRALSPAAAAAVPDELQFLMRAAEKAFERARLWNRAILWTETAIGHIALLAPGIGAALWPMLASQPHGSESVGPVRSVEIVICTFGRLEELLVSIDSVLAEIGAAPVPTLARVIYQDADLLERLRRLRPDLENRADLAFELSSPPSLTGARNRALAGSSADLVVFVDDDVKLRTGFLVAYLDAAQRCPDAIGFAGRIQSPSEWEVGRARAIGQIRATGHVDVNYNSVNRDATYVALTPMGANMAFRRQRMNRLFGKSWFDENLTGSAIREESTLALEVNRAGEYLVFVPDAALEHFEARRGGCGNREQRSVPERVRHRVLETLFLARLYRGAGLLHGVSAARAAIQEIARSEGVADKLKAAGIHLAGYVGARRRYRAGVDHKSRVLELVPKLDLGSLKTPHHRRASP